MADHKTELAIVFKDMDLDMIHQAMELYGSPSPEATLSSASSSTSIPSVTSSVGLDETDCGIDQLLHTVRRHERIHESEPYGDHAYIMHLPPELLVLIFTHCIASDPDIISTLAQVCWEWYTVATSSASLWQRISLSDAIPFSPRSLRRKVKLWTKRSGALPVDFEMRSERKDAVLPMVSYLAQAVERWGNGTLIGRAVGGRVRCRFEKVESGEENGKEEKGRSTRFKNLTIGLAPASEYASDLYAPLDADTAAVSSPTAERTIPFNFSHPQFRLTHIFVSEVCSLPPAETLAPFQTVTKLSIHNMSDDMEMPIHNIVQALEAFPVLEELEVGNVLSQDPTHPGDSQCYSLEPVFLPRLRYLSIMSISSLRCFLSNITTPSLTNLSLIHLNTSTLYETELPGEPGDSDDEMNDFSQSPWTDHATGMGLRSLFSRCTPPLRVLIMDYADMRTKDFRWAFRTLTHLEHLRIVASDMSDNVARSLEPDAARKWLPLPRLKTLSVTHCQKVGGEAFMRMVDRRLEAAERGEVRRLEQVRVVDCMWFSAEQVQELAGKMEESRRRAVREEMRMELLGGGEKEERDADLDTGAELRRALTTDWIFPAQH
jgi:hypothetical protein